MLIYDSIYIKLTYIDFYIYRFIYTHIHQPFYKQGANLTASKDLLKIIFISES